MTSQKPVKTRLGDILLAKGLITDDQLQSAIHAQKASQLPLGEILIQNKWVSQWQIKRALRTQSNLRNAVLTSILSLSPLALVGCGSGGSTTPESTTSVEQVIDASQVNADQSISEGSSVVSGSNDLSADDQTVVVNRPIINSPPDNQSSTVEDGLFIVVDSTDSSTEEPAIEASTPEEEATLEPPIVVEEPVVNDPVIVEEEVAVLGIVELSWDYPEKRMDGSDFNVYEIQGFKIYQLSSEGDVDNVYDVDGLDTDYTVENLEQGEYFFAITVVDIDGLESVFSEAISVPIQI